MFFLTAPSCVPLASLPTFPLLFVLALLATFVLLPALAFLVLLLLALVPPLFLTPLPERFLGLGIVPCVPGMFDLSAGDETRARINSTLLLSHEDYVRISLGVQNFPVIVEYFEQVMDMCTAEGRAASPHVAVVIVAASVAVFVFIVFITVPTSVTAPPTVFLALFLTATVFLTLFLAAFGAVATKFPSATLVDPRVPRILNLVAADWTRVRVHFALLFVDFVGIWKTPTTFTSQSSKNHLQLMLAEPVAATPITMIVIIIVAVTMASKQTLAMLVAPVLPSILYFIARHPLSIGKKPCLFVVELIYIRQASNQRPMMPSKLLKYVLNLALGEPCRPLFSLHRHLRQRGGGRVRNAGRVVRIFGPAARLLGQLLVEPFEAIAILSHPLLHQTDQLASLAHPLYLQLLQRKSVEQPCHIVRLIQWHAPGLQS
jgi:hypothetical protein